MRNIAFTLFCTFLFSFSLAAQTVNKTLEPAMKSGNAKAIAKYFNTQVELALPEGEDKYSKSQAEKLLASFFEATQPNGFTTMHSGASKNELSYIIGRLQTEKGSYRVSVYLRGDVIEQLHIDTE